MKLEILLLAPLLLSASHAASARAAAILKNNACLLSADKKTGLQLAGRNFSFDQRAPLQIEIVDADGKTQWLNGNYSSVKSRNGVLKCAGQIVSPNGTQFQISDEFTRDAAGFLLSRNVQIAAPNARDVGFASRFGLAWSAPQSARAAEILMPGVWYGHNEFVNPSAFGSDADYQSLMTRGDRLGLPLVAARDPKSGVSLELERVGGTPTTSAGDSGGQRLIDARLQVGSLGFLNAGHLQPTFVFPATEDERAIIGPDAPIGRRFAPRSHPVKVGVQHAYRLHFEMEQTPDFASLVEKTTKSAITRAHSPLFKADLNQVYRASLDLLDAVVAPYNGTVAVPFFAAIPSGEVKDTSTQMGFVGMALPCAAFLLRDGYARQNQSEIERAGQVLDFWVNKCARPSGVPQNWADFPAPDKVTFRGFPTHLRVACDGMKGVLDAWNVARANKVDKPEWLGFARSWGDFLVKNQNADGSWFGAWNGDGTPNARYTNASTHPLEFMIELSRATGDEKYQSAALRAGEFCYRTVHQNYAYSGGTPDNPNVTDKEAGVMATEGFMALYDATGDKKWLGAAKQAAIFCETWVYWRNFPIPADTPKQVFPDNRSTVGMSLISTGHSGADDYMAMAPFLWYRIYLATGDAHFLQSARILQHDTKQIMDWNGTLGYKYHGLLPEAVSLSTNRGTGVAGWLPWLTVVNIRPIVQLKNVFGTFDLDEIEKIPLAKRRELSAQFGVTRGF